MLSIYYRRQLQKKNLKKKYWKKEKMKVKKMIKPTTADDIDLTNYLLSFVSEVYFYYCDIVCF